VPGTRSGASLHPALSVASHGPLAGLIGALGFLGAVAWVAWRFGPSLLRLTGLCSWCVAWACGSQAGYGYCLAFLVLGTLTWGAGTIWYAKRRGRWPSAISERLLARVLGGRSRLAELPDDSAVVSLRRQ
jgi:hypothetical protein